MTFFEAALSKYGPTLNASKSRAFCLEPYGLLSFELDESRCDADAAMKQKKLRMRKVQKLVNSGWKLQNYA